MLAVRPVLLYAWTPAPTVAICEKFVHVEPVQRSILKPVSLFELSVHARFIWLLEAAVAVKTAGGAGGWAACVVAMVVFE